MGDDPPLLGLLHVNAIPGHALMFPASLLEHLPDVPEASFFDWWIVVIARAQRNVAAPCRRTAGGISTPCRCSDNAERRHTANEQ